MGDMSYAHGTSSTPLLGETIGADLERTVARFGDREALVSVHQGIRLTYAELDAAIRGLLIEHDQTGARVAADVLRFRVVDTDNDVEPTIAPLVPDRRQQRLAVRAMRR